MLAIFNTVSALLIFNVERRVFLREYSQDLYHTLPYYLSKAIIEAPLQVISAFTLSIMVYFVLGLEPEPANFFEFFFAILNLVLFSSSLGYILGQIFTSPFAANVVSSQIMMPLNILGGFYTNLALVPVWFVWLQYVSPARYCLEAIV